MFKKYLIRCFIFRSEKYQIRLILCIALCSRNHYVSNKTTSTAKRTCLELEQDPRLCLSATSSNNISLVSMVYISSFSQSNQIRLIFLQLLSVVLSILGSVYFHLKQDLLYVFQWLSSKKYLVSSSSQSPEIHFKTYSTAIGVRPLTKSSITTRTQLSLLRISGCVTRYTTHKPLPNQDTMYGITSHPQSHRFDSLHPPPCHPKAKSSIDPQLLADLLPLSMEPRRVVSVLRITPWAIPYCSNGSFL